MVEELINVKHTHHMIQMYVVHHLMTGAVQLAEQQIVVEMYLKVHGVTGQNVKKTVIQVFKQEQEQKHQNMIVVTVVLIQKLKTVIHTHASHVM